MTHTMIMRDHRVSLTDAEKAIGKKVLTEVLRGVDDQHTKRWRKVVNTWFGLEEGEITTVDTRHPRSGPFHRFHMAMEQAVFDAQERFTDFDQFRNWLKIQVGHVTWVPGTKSGIVPLPKSTSYAEMEEVEMREFHEKMLAAFHGPVIAPFFWKLLDPEEAGGMMKSILDGFEK
ncbi:hypothetical protein hmeg3_07655 [Herbaspirillum sp. meg3]|uniref:DUF1367 family protein n=1 Tax=Herbaspirillum sp. meg3 TaxID=2025949 RepID=UPI000B9938B9|nr:DUF1367 family protein [Herbaspirillum sp. meg3]ASU38185.1 hypothetical protein hmeg3_07655 [Herbaspirillum sp. meg3]